MEIDLSVVIIDTNNCQQTLACLRSINANTYQAQVEIFVVDNASTDGSSEAIETEFPNVHLIRNDVRKGFSTNNNLALSKARGRYRMLLNDDTLLLNPALDILVAYMDAHPKIGAIGGALYNPDGSFQGGYDDFPNPARDALEPLSTWLCPRIVPVDQPTPVDWVCGACMLVRQEVIDQVGVLDTAFDPLYTEETDWCYRIRKQGWEIYLHPEARLIHFGGQTMNRMPLAKVEYLHSHQELFYKKHYGAIAVGAFRITLFFMGLLKTGVWSLLYFAKVKHAREELRVHWREVKLALHR